MKILIEQIIASAVASDEEVFDVARARIKKTRALSSSKDMYVYKRSVDARHKEAIKLEGQFDMDAYNEKFEKTEKTAVKEEEEKVQEEPAAVSEEEKDQEDLLNSIDYIKSVLGISSAEQQVQENAEEKEK